MSKVLSDCYDLRDLEIEGQKLSATLFLPENLVYFDGHFEDMPILPGVVQIHWAIELACEHLKIEGEFIGVDILKFKQIITPGYLVEIEVVYDPVKGTLNFTYTSEQGNHSVGRVRFA